MGLFPHFPLHLSPMALFGITLLLGLIGGEIAKRIPFLPIISGYIAIGFLVGPGGFNIINTHIVTTANVFVEISLSLILFELGRNLDFRWLYHDRGLLLMALAESALTFGLIFALVYQFVGLTWLQSAFAATIAMATSPAVVMLVANDLSSEGPVTRRTLILTSLNNLFALILFTILLPLTQTKISTFSVIVSHSLYRLIGSIVLGLVMFFIAELIATLTAKNKENQFVLFVGLVMLTTNLAQVFHLSTMLALLSLGIIARNVDRNHRLMEVDFSWLARLFFILLFVVAGIHLQLRGFWQATAAVLLFIFVRAIAKTLGVCLFAKMSKITKYQALAISIALSPMAEISIGMTTNLMSFNPDFGRPILFIVTSVVTLLYVLGPVATQFAFITMDEAISPTSKNKVYNDNTIPI